MRPLRMANEFVRRGIETLVLAGDIGTYDSTLQVDSSMSSLISGEIQLCRPALGPPPSRILRRLISSGYAWEPDETFRRWKSSLLPILEDRLREFRPDVVLVTMPPFSMHSVVLYLARHHREVPVVADFRDAWSQWILAPYPSYLHYRYRVWCERKTIESSMLTMTTSLVTLRDLRELHGERVAERLRYVPNSFDHFVEERFTNLDLDKPELSLLYLGSFYYNPQSQRLLDKPWYRKSPHQWLQYSPRREDWSYRSPLRLLQIFDRLLEIRPGRVKLIFAGRKPGWWADAVFSQRLRDHTEHVGPLPKDEALERLTRADALIITSSKVLGGPDYSIAGKTYEYLASRKPILAFVCNGAQRDLLAESGAALVLDPDEKEASAQQLAALLAGNLTLSPNHAFIEGHLTGNVMERLLETLERRLLGETGR